MVTRAGGYFVFVFKGCRVVTQGYPVSPTLFNMVLDAFIRHWVTVVAATKEGLESIDLPIRDMAAYFYSDDGLVASPQLERLQSSFDVLTGLFDRVGLWKNARNTVSMACYPCHTPVRILVE